MPYLRFFIESSILVMLREFYSLYDVESNFGRINFFRLMAFENACVRNMAYYIPGLLMAQLGTRPIGKWLIFKNLEENYINYF